jgi:sulfite reductase (NADPH) flavoprotein alpha-component
MLSKELSALASPLDDQANSHLQQAISSLSPQQLAWASGYIWGLSQNQSLSSSNPTSSIQEAVASQPAGKLTIIFASQTGNAKGVA